MQNKPHFFFLETGVPKRGGEGGGSDTWEKFPKNPVFFCGERPLGRRAVRDIDILVPTRCKEREGKMQENGDVSKRQCTADKKRGRMRSKCLQTKLGVRLGKRVAVATLGTDDRAEA